MPEKTKKATFNFRIDTLSELDELVLQGAASSKNALVEQALLKEMKEIKRLARKALWEEAAKDPLFMKDITDIESDFRYADTETIRNID